MTTGMQQVVRQWIGGMGVALAEWRMLQTSVILRNDTGSKLELHTGSSKHNEALQLRPDA